MKALTTFPISIFVLLFSATTSYANINFETVDIESVFEKAKASERFIFVEFSAEHCGPCVWMETNVFSDPQVARFVNINFIPVKSNGISVNSKFEKYKYNIQMFPTILFLAPDGEEIARIEGKTDAVNLEEIARLVTENKLEELEKLLPKKKEVVPDPNPINNEFPDFPKRVKTQMIVSETTKVQVSK
ncbi:MAG: thioredoxin family protein [Bacteroidota bacterium]